MKNNMNYIKKVNIFSEQKEIAVDEAIKAIMSEYPLMSPYQGIMLRLWFSGIADDLKPLLFRLIENNEEIADVLIETFLNFHKSIKVV